MDELPGDAAISRAGNGFWHRVAGHDATPDNGGDADAMLGITERQCRESRRAVVHDRHRAGDHPRFSCVVRAKHSRPRLARGDPAMLAVHADRTAVARGETAFALERCRHGGFGQERPVRAAIFRAQDHGVIVRCVAVRDTVPGVEKRDTIVECRGVGVAELLGPVRTAIGRVKDPRCRSVADAQRPGFFCADGVNPPEVEPLGARNRVPFPRVAAVTGAQHRAGRATRPHDVLVDGAH